MLRKFVPRKKKCIHDFLVLMFQKKDFDLDVYEKV